MLERPVLLAAQQAFLLYALAETSACERTPSLHAKFARWVCNLGGVFTVCDRSLRQRLKPVKKQGLMQPGSYAMLELVALVRYWCYALQSICALICNATRLCAARLCTMTAWDTIALIQLACRGPGG